LYLGFLAPIPLLSSVYVLLREVLYHHIRFGRNKWNSLKMYKEQRNRNSCMYRDINYLVLESGGTQLVSRSVIPSTTIAIFVSLRGRPCCLTWR
jgi:hypothetical protein